MGVKSIVEKIRKLIPKSELDYIVDIDKKQAMVVNLAGISIGVALSVIGFNWYLSRNTVVNQDIPTYICPASYDMDTSVPLQTLDELNVTQYKRLAAGMIRNYVNHQFMRTVDDIEPSLNYLVNHSMDGVQRKYKEYQRNVDDIKRNITSNQRMRFYQKLGTDIRFPKGIGNPFVVEIDGFIIREKGTKEEFMTVTLRYQIRRATRTESNAQGLYVQYDEIVIMKDAISNEKVVEDGI